MEHSHHLQACKASWIDAVEQKGIFLPGESGALGCGFQSFSTSSTKLNLMVPYHNTFSSFEVGDMDITSHQFTIDNHHLRNRH